MRKYGGLMLIAVVFCAIMAVTPRTAFACSCALVPLSEYADEVALAFTGRQLERVELIPPDSSGVVSTADPVILVFQVHWVYKGRVGTRVEVRTVRGRTSCGIDFGGRGVTGVAAFETREGGLQVSSCWSSVTSAELEEVFGEGYPADPEVEALRQKVEESAREAETSSLQAELLAREAEVLDPRDGVSTTVQVLLAAGVLVILVGMPVVFLKLRGRGES